jgi:hypothetical protein
VTTEDLKELFAPSGLRGMLPEGAVLVGARSTEIEAIPAGILEYMQRVDRAGMTMLLHTCSLSFLSGSTLVQVQFTVGGGPDSERDVAQRMRIASLKITLLRHHCLI